MHWLYLVIAIVAEVVGTSFLRASAGFTKLLPSIMVVAGYGLAFFFLSLTLERIPVGIAYAVWSGAGVTLITAIGWLFLGQKLDPAAMVGMGLIVAGVVVPLSHAAASTVPLTARPVKPRPLSVADRMPNAGVKAGTTPRPGVARGLVIPVIAVRLVDPEALTPAT